MPIIFSTLTSPNTYTLYKESESNVSQQLGSVTINGGANSVNRKNLQTPRGVATTVTDEQLELLMGNEVFRLHKVNGFITIDAAKDARDADEVAAQMTGRDESAPLVDSDYEEGQAPIVNKDEAVEVAVVTPSTPAPRRTRGSN